jgi:ABC-2 type transport system permease protein
MFIIPSVMIIFFTIMFYGGEITDLPIVVVDKSHSPMSRQLLEMTDATRGVRVAFEVESIAEAERLMLDGDVAAIIYIPDSFESDIYSGVVAKVECYTLGTNISAEGIISENLQQVIMTFSAGIAINKLQSMGVGYSKAMVEIMPNNILYFNPYIFILILLNRVSLQKLHITA